MFKQADLIESIQSVPWFLELKPENLGKLIKIASMVTLDAGETLFVEGDRADHLYIILEGQVELISQVPGHGAVRFFSAESLDVIGWSCLTQFIRQRSATAHAVTSIRMVRLEGAALAQLCDQDHDIGFVIMRRLSNVIASHLLTTRLQLYDIIVHSPESTQHESPEK
jgi:CRP/FNR family transcriptional regulator, cyclic AMP receptor protein